MTYEEAVVLCAMHDLHEHEAQVYHRLLDVLEADTAPATLNLFPILMHFLSDAMASQIAQEPLHTREGRIVELAEEVLALVRTLVLAKCVLAEDIEEQRMRAMAHGGTAPYSYIHIERNMYETVDRSESAGPDPGLGTARLGGESADATL